MTTRELLGEGELGWWRRERVTDRYGFVFLDPQMKGRADLSSRKGRLVAEVVETHDSTHIGDPFHGVRPSRPEVGETVVLGEGYFTTFAEKDGRDVYVQVGLKPEDNRETLWLDPEGLYQVHAQTVKLYFEFEENA